MASKEYKPVHGKFTGWFMPSGQKKAIDFPSVSMWHGYDAIIVRYRFQFLRSLFRLFLPVDTQGYLIVRDSYNQTAFSGWVRIRGLTYGPYMATIDGQAFEIVDMEL